MEKEQLRRYARLGASARLADLERERQEILRAFPELRNERSPGTRALVEDPDRLAGGETGSRRGRRSMSAAQRKAVSARMKRYWATRRAEGSPAKKRRRSQAPTRQDPAS